LSNASRILNPRPFRCLVTLRARAFPAASASERYLPERNPQASGK
jgi:hypothetical protein